ncbi:MAG: GNAT family N-acetyltransferase [Actinomycetota bacterium]|nr:GNAT family N-acetyltransferase [Actinomycetota bacterium]
MTATLTPPRSAALRLETFTSFDDAEAIAPQWDALVARLSGSLYMTFSWCQVWWRHYGAGRELRLIMIHADEELVGVLPFFIDRLWLPAGRTRAAKLIGSDSVIAVVDAPVVLEVAEEAFALAVSQLFLDDRADMVHVGPLPGEAAGVAAIRRSCSGMAGIAQIIRDREAGSHTLFELPEGFDAYLRGLSKNHRSNYRRNLNKLDKTFRFEVDVVRDADALECEFEAFVEMHQAQWQAVNKLGHFDDWPGSREFSRDLVRTLAQTDHVRLVRLLADDRVVAYYWCFAMNGVYYWRLPARVTGQEWDRFALGRVGLIKMMQVAATEGATAIEAGSGRYEYKEQLNAKSLPLRSITLCRRGLGPRLRVLLTLAYGELLNLIYYRLWYIRLAPRMGALRGPLRRGWIRRRF